MKKQIKNIKNLKSETEEILNSRENSFQLSPNGLKKQDKFLENSNNSNQKQKLIEQNIRLKTQIFDLTKQLDDIMGKQEKRKKKYYAKDEQDDQATKAKKNQLKKQQLEVQSLKNRITIIKKQLQAVYTNGTLQAREDELKRLKTELESLQQQKKNLLRIKNDQNKVLKIVKNEQQYEQKIQELRRQLQSTKQQSKILNQKLIQTERMLRKNHEIYIIKQNKMKQLEGKQQKQANSMIKSKRKTITQSASPQMIQQLEQEIASLEQQRRDNQKIWHDKISAIDNDLKQKKGEQQKKLMILKQKEKELRLNQIKIKEMKRLIKTNNTENSQILTPQDLDMHQFRHRRNIKYMKQ